MLGCGSREGRGVLERGRERGGAEQRRKGKGGVKFIEVSGGIRGVRGFR